MGVRYGGRPCATVLVGVDEAVVTGALGELEAAGWRSTTREALPPHPWDLAAADLVVAEPLREGVVSLDRYEEMARRRVRLVLSTRSWELGCLFFDALNRIGRAELITPDLVPETWYLTSAQRAILSALSDGASASEAARRAHVSQRTAARHLSQARQSLGVPTTAAATAVVGSRLLSVAPPVRD